jgi:hypothetical protein
MFNFVVLDSLSLIFKINMTNEIHVKNFGRNNLGDYKREIDRGGKFVRYRYAVAFFYFARQVETDIYFVRGGESGFLRGFGYSLISLLAGWWEFPLGPVYTAQSIYTNLRGGLDVTDEVMEYQKYRLNPRNQYF